MVDTSCTENKKCRTRGCNGSECVVAGKNSDGINIKILQDDLAFEKSVLSSVFVGKEMTIVPIWPVRYRFFFLDGALYLSSCTMQT